MRNNSPPPPPSAALSAVLHSKVWKTKHTHNLGLHLVENKAHSLSISPFSFLFLSIFCWLCGTRHIHVQPKWVNYSLAYLLFFSLCSVRHFYWGPFFSSETTQSRQSESAPMSSIISADYVTWTFKSLKKYDEVPGRVFFSFSFEVNERRHPPKRIRCIYFLLMLMLNCCCCVVPYAFSFLFDGFVFFSFRDFCKRRLDLCAYFPVGLF
jgi:predicted signal transduction protein with EAL and GGDEF domain